MGRLDVDRTGSASPLTPAFHDSDNSDSESNPLPRGRLFAICGLLLFASAINYMDRQTLANVAARITKEFSLSEQQYGNLEMSFGLSFAAGSMFFGVLADRCSIRYLYPIVLLLWSAIGFLTGYAEDYGQLLGCRGMLGFFEAGHWPCGLKTTQALLSRSNRALGNGVLQSGTSIGAIVTPLILYTILTPTVGSWRFGFQLVGAIGVVWIAAWFFIVRSSDFPAVKKKNERSSAALGEWWRDLLTRRMLVVVIVVTFINGSWQILRAWLPKIMQQGHGYEELFTLRFTSVWYAVTDIGCLSSGLIALWLYRSGWTIKYSRCLAFGVCTAMCASLMSVPFLGGGPWLLVVFLIAGAGSLGMFPLYHAFSQDISREHQGKVTGITGVIAWGFSSPTQSIFGYLADQTGSYNIGIAIAGSLPLVALAAIFCLWPNEPERTSKSGTYR